MAVSLATFRLLYPEFDSASDTRVQAQLDLAAKSIDSTIWGDEADHGHGLLTAHQLSLAPGGTSARLASTFGKTVYGVEYQRIEAKVTCALRVF